MTKALVSFGVVLTMGMAIWLGLYVRHEMQCSALKEDVLNSVSNMKGAAALRTLALDKAADTIEESSQRDSQAAMSALIDKCGKRALDTAVREASEILLR